MHQVDLLVLDGATGAGKSTVLAYLRSHYPKAIRVGQKLTTRPPRNGDNDWEFNFVTAIPEHLKEYSFGSVRYQYAINRTELELAQREAIPYAVSCVDRPMLLKLRSSFRIVCVYIYRTWNENEMEMMLAARNSSAEDIEHRKEEIKNVITDYASKVALYDHVIFNDGRSSVLHDQVDFILARYALGQGGER